MKGGKTACLALINGSLMSAFVPLPVFVGPISY